MSYKKVEIIPVNPATTRGIATKLSASKDKIVYTNGRTVVVRLHILEPDISVTNTASVDSQSEGTKNVPNDNVSYIIVRTPQRSSPILVTSKTPRLRVSHLQGTTAHQPM